MFWWLMIFFTVSWLSGLLSADICISTGVSDANTDYKKQPIFEVRVPEGLSRW